MPELESHFYGIGTFQHSNFGTDSKVGDAGVNSFVRLAGIMPESESHIFGIVSTLPHLPASSTRMKNFVKSECLT